LKDYYLILGVNRNASSSEIKTAYRNGCKQFHPDKNAHPDAHLRFIEIHEAYEFLGDEKQRKAYDLAQRTRITPRYENYYREKEYAARHRAREYARQDFEQFKKSKYYKLAVGLNSGFNYLFLAICIFIIAVPIYMYIMQQDLPEAEQRPFISFLFPIILGLTMGIWASYYWLIKKQDIFTNS
jgi:curved DNA-binding protein CbpA